MSSRFNLPVRHILFCGLVCLAFHLVLDKKFRHIKIFVLAYHAYSLCACQVIYAVLRIAQIIKWEIRFVVCVAGIAKERLFINKTVDNLFHP